MLRVLLGTILISSLSFAAEGLQIGFEYPGPAQGQLVISGTFIEGSAGQVRVQSVSLVHPPGRFFQTPPGTLDIGIEDPDLRISHTFSRVERTFRVRLNSAGMAGQPQEQINQLSPQFAARYKVRVNGVEVGELSVGIAGLMSFDEISK